MKNRYLVVIVLILGIMSGLALNNLVAAPTVSAADSDNDIENRLHVSGSGEVKANPDQVEISLGVETIKDTAQEAREENARHDISSYKFAERNRGIKRPDRNCEIHHIPGEGI